MDYTWVLQIGCWGKGNGQSEGSGGPRPVWLEESGAILKWALQRGEDKLKNNGKGSGESVDYEGPRVTKAEMSTKQLATDPLLEA